MTNRQVYITKKNEYDMMMDIVKNTNVCPVYAISGKPTQGETFCLIMTYQPRNLKSCSACIQKWLNEDERREQI